MAYGVKSHKFLCCLPVRLGVFILSFVHFLLAGLIAGLLWAALGLNDIHLNKPERIPVIIAAIHSTLFALIAILALYGTITRRLSLVQTYSDVLNWMLGFSLVVGIVNIVILFTKSKQEFIDLCVDGRLDQDVINGCQHVNTIRFVVLSFFIIMWLLDLYECIIVGRYVIQLGEEKQEKYRLKSMKAQMYDTIPGRESTEAFAVQFPDTAAGSSRAPHMDAKGEVKLYGASSHEAV